MISKETLKLIGFIVNYPCRYYLASSFSWNDSDLQCVITRRSCLRWKIGFSVLTTYFLFLLYGLVNLIANFHSKDIPFHIAFHVVFLVGYFTAMCDKINYVRCRNFYVPTVNALLEYFQDFSETYEKGHMPQGRRNVGGNSLTLLNYCIEMCIYNIICMPFLSLVDYFRRSTSSVYLTSLLVGHPNLLSVSFYPTALLNVLLIGSMISELTFNTVITIVPLYFYTTVFQTFRYQDQRKHANLSESLKSVAKITHFIRAAQVVQILYGRLLQGRIVPLHFAVSYLAIICTFSFIRFHERLTWEVNFILLSTGCSAIFGWMVVLWFFGRYYTSSRKFLLFWKNASSWPNNSHERKLMKKFYRSCRPIEFVTVPRILRFRPVIVLKFIHFVNWAIAKSLIVASGEKS